MLDSMIKRFKTVEKDEFIWNLVDEIRLKIRGY